MHWKGWILNNIKMHHNETSKLMPVLKLMDIFIGIFCLVISINSFFCESELENFKKEICNLKFAIYTSNSNNFQQLQQR